MTSEPDRLSRSAFGVMPQPTGPVIAVAGDWHGHRAWAGARLQSLGERGVDVVVHCGDLGIWPGPTGKAYLRTIDTVCARYGIALLVVPGNHEDWGRLTALWANPKNRAADGTALPLALTDHVNVLPRGFRWNMRGRTFVALGGAPSLDRDLRVEGRDWWPQEQVTTADVDRTVAGGYADVMVTHDAPGPPWAVPEVEAIIESNPMGWPQQALDYARTGRERLTRAFLGVRPRLLVHGHYHCAGEGTFRFDNADYETTVWSLHMQGHDGNVRLLDLDTLCAPARG